MSWTNADELLYWTHTVYRLDGFVSYHTTCIHWD